MKWPQGYFFGIPIISRFLDFPGTDALWGQKTWIIQVPALILTVSAMLVRGTLHKEDPWILTVILLQDSKYHYAHFTNKGNWDFAQYL